MASEEYEHFEGDIAKVVQVVADGLEGHIGGTNSDAKTVVIGTSEATVNKIVELTGGRWKGAEAVRNLGVDVSYVTQTATTQRARQAAAALRTGRFAFLRRLWSRWRQ